MVVTTSDYPCMLAGNRKSGYIFYDSTFRACSYEVSQPGIAGLARGSAHALSYRNFVVLFI